MRMQRIVVLNPKGGSGKTTIAINLAGYYALRANGRRCSIMTHRLRPPVGAQASAGPAAFHLVSTSERDNRVTRAFQLRIPTGTGRVIVDTAAGLDAHDMPELNRQADRSWCRCCLPTSTSTPVRAEHHQSAAGREGAP